jgi:integrase
MASVWTAKDGNRTVEFIHHDGRRPKIRLGQVTKRTADQVARRVELLSAANGTGTPIDLETIEWLAKISPKLYDKLAELGLVARREAALHTAVVAFIDGYIAELESTSRKPGTITNLKIVRNDLAEHYGPKRLLESVTVADAAKFRRWLSNTEENGGRGLALNTVRRRCGRARQLFKEAVDRRMIRENPFGKMKDISVQQNEKRFYFISRGEAQKVLDACPDAEWRLLFALGRFGGLRCPSEHLELKWSDINWAENRMIVRSPKTEHIDGHEERVVPLFPELLSHLQALWEETPPDTIHVVNRYRKEAGKTKNLGTQLKRIIRRAGLRGWPKVWQNLRSTRQTELSEKHPMHVVCAWMGNSERVAKKHYLQVTEADFTTATGDNYSDANELRSEKRGAESGAVCGVSDEIERMEAHEKVEISRDIRKSRVSRCYPMTPTGLEPVLPA